MRCAQITIALISPTHLYILLNGMLATYSIKTNAQLIFVHWQLIIGCSFVCYIWKNKRFSTTSLAFAAFSRAAQAYDHLAAHQRLLQHLEIN